jgi:prevent-host-death family protein
MRTFTSADAKNNFGELIDMARAAPVAITKYDRRVVVVMAVEEFERLKDLRPPRSSTIRRIRMTKTEHRVATELLKEIRRAHTCCEEQRFMKHQISADFIL